MISHLKLPTDILDFNPSPWTILSLSGGGYRGLFTAEVLTQLQSRPEANDILRGISLFSGTSVGGLIAAALALGRSPASIRDAILHHGAQIFDDRYRIFGCSIPITKPRGRGGLFKSKYRQANLADAIFDILGEQSNILVADVPKPLVLVATCAVRKRPVVISNVAPLDPLSSRMTLVEGLLATAAAPSYFAPLELNGQHLIDGGVVANAPDLVALFEVLSKGRGSLETCRMISIGTAKPDPAAIPKSMGRRGLIAWAPRFFTIVAHAQEHLAVEQARILLGERYFRLDSRPSAEQATELDLDRASAKATETLQFLARAAVDEIPSSILSRVCGSFND